MSNTDERVFAPIPAFSFWTTDHKPGIGPPGIQANNQSNLANLFCPLHKPTNQPAAAAAAVGHGGPQLRIAPALSLSGSGSKTNLSFCRE